MKLQRKVALLLSAGSLAMLGASPVLAHTSYLLPVSFGLTAKHVTLMAALTEDDILVPEHPIKDGEYHLITPGGKQHKLDKPVTLKNFVAIDIDLPEDGTYKITTGEKVGRITKMAKIDGRWLAIRAPRPGQSAAAPAAPMAEKEDEHKAPRSKSSEGSAKKGDAATANTTDASAAANAKPAAKPAPRFIEEAKVPAGAEIIEVKNINKLETYLTKGAPSSGAIKTTGQGFEVKPVIHPNEIFVDQGASFDVLFNGKPVKDLTFSLYKGGNSYEDKKSSEVKTDAQGRLVLTFDRPGVYMLKARYPATPKGPITEKPATESYSYTLTFEVSR